MKTAKKLTRRERALIQHAIRRYLKTESLTIYVGKHPLRRMTLMQLRFWNIIEGRPEALAIYFAAGTKLVDAEHWRND